MLGFPGRGERALSRAGQVRIRGRVGAGLARSALRPWCGRDARARAVEGADDRPRFLTAREDAVPRAGILRLGLVTLCVACQPQPEVYHVERARPYAADKAVVWDGVLRFLQANDITVVSADGATGVIHAERTAYQDAGWAYCERAWITDRSSDSRRPRRARPISRDLALEVAVRESAVGVEVQPVARFTEQQHNRWRNMPFTQPCQSTGALERALLDALGGTPPPAPPAPPETSAPDELSLSPLLDQHFAA
jgi:hypothetical protein